MKLACNLACNTVKDNISNYIDGQLSGDLGWQIDMHLATCPDCAKLTRSLRQTVNLLAQLPPKPLSADFDAKLAAKLAAVEQAQPSAVRSGFGRWLDSITESTSNASRTMTLRIGVTAAALSVVGFFLILPHPQNQNTNLPETQSARVAPTSVDSEDAMFVAACANEQSQTSDAQTLTDPTAQSLAARFDEVSGDAAQPSAAASSAQD